MKSHVKFPFLPYSFYISQFFNFPIATKIGNVIIINVQNEHNCRPKNYVKIKVPEDFLIFLRKLVSTYGNLTIHRGHAHSAQQSSTSQKYLLPYRRAPREVKTKCTFNHAFYQKGYIIFNIIKAKNETLKTNDQSILVSLASLYLV